MKKKGLCLAFLLPLFLLSACGDHPKSDMEEKSYKLESDFKTNYQLWVDMKADGNAQYTEYVNELKTVGNKFKSLGTIAKTTTYKKLLSEEDQGLYETYRVVGEDVVKMADFLTKKKYPEAKEMYQTILKQEESVKE